MVPVAAPARRRPAPAPRPAAADRPSRRAAWSCPAPDVPVTASISPGRDRHRDVPQHRRRRPPSRPIRSAYLPPVACLRAVDAPSQGASAHAAQCVHCVRASTPARLTIRRARPVAATTPAPPAPRRRCRPPRRPGRSGNGRSGGSSPASGSAQPVSCPEDQRGEQAGQHRGEDQHRVRPQCRPAQRRARRRPWVRSADRSSTRRRPVHRRGQHQRAGRQRGRQAAGQHVEPQRQRRALLVELGPQLRRPGRRR